MKPEFLCIGAQKAGTTWLFTRLCDHPEFSMPPVKELHYFDRSPSYPSSTELSETRMLKRLRKRGYVTSAVKVIVRSLRARQFRRARWWSRYYFRDYSDTWYKRLFEAEVGISGDITPSYSILSPEDVARVHGVVPDARLVFLLRNPIDRAWSMWRDQLTSRLGRDSSGAIDPYGLDASKAYVNSPAQELRSNYLRTIDLYLSSFDASQLLLGFYDAIADQPDQLLAELLRHIGAKAASIRTNLREINNRSIQMDMPAAYRQFLEEKYCHDLEELARRYGGYAARWFSSLAGVQPAQAIGASRLPPVVHP